MYSCSLKYSCILRYMYSCKSGTCTVVHSSTCTVAHQVHIQLYTQVHIVQLYSQIHVQLYSQIHIVQLCFQVHVQLSFQVHGQLYIQVYVKLYTQLYMLEPQNNGCTVYSSTAIVRSCLQFVLTNASRTKKMGIALVYAFDCDVFKLQGTRLNVKTITNQQLILNVTLSLVKPCLTVY